MDKKAIMILLSITGLISGILLAFIPVSLFLAVLAVFLFTGAMLLDYTRFLYVLGFYVLIDYFFRYILQSGILSSFWDELLLLFAIGLWLYKWIIYRNQPGYISTPMDIPIIFFITVSFCMLLINSPVIEIGIAGFRQVVQQILWYFIAVQLINSKKNVRWLLYVTVFIGGVLGLHGIYQYITVTEMPSYWVDRLESGITTRVYSIIGSPNILGSLMVLLIPVSISFIYSENKLLKKYLFGCITIAMCTTLVFTSSRSAWIGFILSLGIYFWLKDKRLILLLVISVFLAYSLVPTITHRINYLLSPEYLISSAVGGRVARWRIGLEALMQHPFFGLGLGQFGGAVAQNYKIPDAFYIDNYFLKIAVEMGLTGLTAFCLLIYNSLIWGLRAVNRISCKESKSMAQGIFAGMIGVVVPNLVENVFEVPMMLAYFWVFAAGLISLGFTLPEESESELPA